MELARLDDFTPEQGLELPPFKAAFPVVNAVVYDILDDRTLSRPATREDAPGVTHYRIWLESSNTTLSLKVLQRGEELTSLRVQAYPPPAGLISSAEDNAWLNSLMAAIHLEVDRVLRFSHPDYTHKTMALTPPPPHWSEGVLKLLMWRYLYAKNLSDMELAQVAGVAYSTFANTKAEAKAEAEKDEVLKAIWPRLNPQQVKRGRPKKKQ